MKRAVFLDRDGVLTHSEVRDGKAYAPRRMEDFVVFPEAASVLEQLKQRDFLLIVVTNQPDVGNGLVEKNVVETMHQKLRADLPIDDIKVCYASQKENSPMRKPAPGMLLEAAEEWDIDLKESFMIGDRWSDVAAGKAAGCKTIFIHRGYQEQLPDRPNYVAKSLEEALEAIIEQETEKKVEYEVEIA
ncbi:MAG: D-glycero-alpha-D-manno-heptose-1,7-bisphosphate 7-phosphatase [Verrucomicrobiota bacterium]